MISTIRLLALILFAFLAACTSEGQPSRSFEDRLARAQLATGVGDWTLEKTICHTASFACNLQTLQYDKETDSIAAFVSSGIFLGANTLGGFSITGIDPAVPDTQNFIYTYAPDGRFISYESRYLYDWISGQHLPNPHQFFTYRSLTPTGSSIGTSSETGLFHLVYDYGSRSRLYNGLITDPDGTEFDPNQYASSRNDWLCVVETNDDFRVLMQRPSDAGETQLTADTRVNLFELRMSKNGLDSFTVLASNQRVLLDRPACANTVQGVTYVTPVENELLIYTNGVVTTGADLGLPLESILSFNASGRALPFGQANKLGFLLKDYFVMGNSVVEVPPHSRRAATDLRRLYVLTSNEGIVEVWSAPLR